MFKLYKKPSLKNWHGRIDDPLNSKSWRWHQVVEPLNLSKPLHAKQGGFCLIGYACDEGVRRNQGRVGAKSGPDATRKMMGSLPVHNAGQFHLYDAGDILCRRGKLEPTQTELKNAVLKILAAGLFPVVLGGGHDVSYGHYQALKQHTKKSMATPIIKKIGIINFDAHFDLRDHAGGSHSGSPFLQIADHVKASGENFDYFVLGIQETSNSVALFEKAAHLGVRYRTAEEINIAPLEESRILLQNFMDSVDALYLTFCLDVLPASVAPGVSATNPYGLNPHRAMALFHHVVDSKKVIGFDIAELSPPHDIDNHTAKFAAYLVFQLTAHLV